MRQYQQVKAKYPDALMLFRVGDFYETFGEDAIKTAKALGITLTSRNNGGSDLELAGFPYHSLDLYLPRLVRAGFRVAICEQTEKPVPGKVVNRAVTEVITPGTASDDRLLDQSRNNYLAAVFADKKDRVGVAFFDVSTGEALVAEGGWAYIDKLLQSFQPSEILLPKSGFKNFDARYGDKFYTYSVEDWVWSLDYGREKLLTHFDVQNLKGYGIEELPFAQIAAGAALYYLGATENNNLKHIAVLSRIQEEKYVWLDRFTIRNLELVNSSNETGKALIDVLDETLCPMGARLMKKWIVLPLKNKAAIEQRLESVAYLIKHPEFKKEVEASIRQIGDLERLISKAPLGKINPREVGQLNKSLGVLEPLKAILYATTVPYFKKMADGLNPCNNLRDEITKTLIPEPPVHINKGGAIAEGADEELDEYRNLVKNAQAALLEIQHKEIERTGIPSLKIGYNSVFGYYLEVTNKYKDHDKIPSSWIRKQTLANAERFITQELKTLEEKILSADEKICALEDQIFQRLIGSLMDYIQPIQHSGSLIAILDCLRSFAEVSVKRKYARPLMNEDFSINIKQGRHPVIERMLPVGESYVPNDVFLDNQTQQILMITGPNMAGKSALLRQTALICLMAQMGCYVPAESAELGLLDRVFTRVGASDHISSGESTFMVEMNETASIMNNLSNRSLLLLDEIGRGTSTYDGISIAWSIAEFLYENPLRPKTLFATHYHELNELAEKYDRIKNYHVATKELGQKVIFLRKLTEGGSRHSFGVHVAKMAGMPNKIVARAHEILGKLEEKHIYFDQTDDLATEEKRSSVGAKLKQLPSALQLNIFDAGDPALSKIKEAIQQLDLNALTPIELMMKVGEWKKMIGDK